MCICDAVEETRLKSESLLRLDIGIGDLYIQLNSDEIKYKFVPSKLLEEGVRKTYTENKNPLMQRIEETLIKKITAVYKELI